MWARFLFLLLFIFGCSNKPPIVNEQIPIVDMSGTPLNVVETSQIKRPSSDKKWKTVNRQEAEKLVYERNCSIFYFGLSPKTSAKEAVHFFHSLDEKSKKKIDKYLNKYFIIYDYPHTDEISPSGYYFGVNADYYTPSEFLASYFFLNMKRLPSVVITFPEGWDTGTDDEPVLNGYAVLVPSDTGEYFPPLDLFFNCKAYNK